MTIVRSVRSEANKLLEYAAKIESIDLLRFTRESCIGELNNSFISAMKFTKRDEDAEAFWQFIKSRLFACFDQSEDGAKDLPSQYEALDKNLFSIRDTAPKAVKDLFENPTSVFNSLFSFYKSLGKILWVCSQLSTLGTEIKQLELQISQHKLESKKHLDKCENAEKELRILNDQTRRFENDKNISANHRIVTEFYANLDTQIKNFRQQFDQDDIDISRKIDKFFVAWESLKKNIKDLRNKINSAYKNSHATFTSLLNRTNELEKKLKSLNLNNIDTTDIIKSPVTIVELETLRTDFEDHKKLDAARLEEFKETQRRLNKEYEKLIVTDVTDESNNLLVEINTTISKIINIHANETIYHVPLIYTPDLKLGNVTRDNVANYQIYTKQAKNPLVDAQLKIEKFIEDLETYRKQGIANLIAYIKIILPTLLNEYKTAYTNLRNKCNEKWREALLRGALVIMDERNAWDKLVKFLDSTYEIHFNLITSIQTILSSDTIQQLAENEIATISRAYIGKEGEINVLKSEINSLENKRNAYAAGVRFRDEVLEEIGSDIHTMLVNYRENKVLELNSIQAVIKAKLENHKSKLTTKDNTVDIPKDIIIWDTTKMIEVENKIKSIETLYQSKLKLLDQKERLLQTQALNAIPTGVPKRPNFFTRHWGKLTLGITTGFIVGAGIGVIVGTATSTVTLGLSIIALAAIGAIAGAILGGSAAVIAAVVSDHYPDPVDDNVKHRSSTHNKINTKLQETAQLSGRKRTVEDIRINTTTPTAPPAKRPETVNDAPLFDTETMDYLDGLNYARVDVPGLRVQSHAYPGKN